jgi:5'-nucleotidase
MRAEIGDMNDMERIALFDMDGSLADYDHSMRAELRRMRSPAEPPILDTDDFHALAEAHPHLRYRMDVVKSVPGWWLNLPRIEAGFEVVTLAAEIGFKIGVLTKGPGRHSLAWKEKLDWIHGQPELEDCDITITLDKSNTYGTLLYDDFAPYMIKWLKNRPRGLGIMPTTTYNSDFIHDRVVRWDGSNQADIVAALTAAYSRAPREALVLG